MCSYRSRCTGLFIFIVSVFLTACGGSSSGGGGDAGGGGGDSTTSGTFYVNSLTGSDANDGLSPAAAKGTIQGAIDAAKAPSEVRVLEGDYTVDSSVGIITHIKLKEGVSLYGGYYLLYSARDPEAHPTIITDIGNGNAFQAVFSNSPDFITTTPPTISTATVIDGFTVNAVTGKILTNSSTGFYLRNASPTISNCIINGGDGDLLSAGILSHLGGSPVIEYNTINGGTSVRVTTGITSTENGTPVIRFNTINGGTSSMGSVTGIINNLSTPNIHNNYIVAGNALDAAVGILNDEASPLIHENVINGGISTTGGTAGITFGDNSTGIAVNNLIFAGSGLVSASGVNVDNSSATIRNNTIHSGFGPKTIGVRSTDGGAPTVENNIFYAGESTNSFGLFEQNITSDFVAVNNNNFFGFEVVYQDSDSGCTNNDDVDDDPDTCNLVDMEMLMDITDGVGSNVNEDPIFMDIDGMDNDIMTMDNNDWHFTPLMSPATTTAGGLNGLSQVPAWSFTIDLDGVTRLGIGNSWSMGAYEPT